MRLFIALAGSVPALAFSKATVPGVVGLLVCGVQVMVLPEAQ